MVNILIGCTGSVASLKLPELSTRLLGLNDQIKIRVVVTKYAKHFFDVKEIPPAVDLFEDDDEWSAWNGRGDPVLHIELVKWADLFLIAPLDANTLGKLANGLCDNLLTCTARAWDIQKPLVFCPAMNTKMYQHPLTKIHIDLLESWGYKHVPVVEKTLICGDVGPGAMAEVDTIVDFVGNIVA